MSKGCLTVLVIFGGLTLFIAAGIIYLLVTAEPTDNAPHIDFTDCSSAEQDHLRTVYQQVFADKEKFYEFPGLKRLGAGSKLDMQRKLVKVWPLEITCTIEDNCQYGANDRGWVVAGNAKVTMCAYTRPTDNPCDTYAGIAFANAYTRNLRDSESAGFFAYARQLCMARSAAS